MRPPLRSRWLIVGWSREIYQAFRAGWRRLPRRARHRWLWTLTAGWGLCFAVQAVLVALGRQATALHARDEALLSALLARFPVEPATALMLDLPGYAHYAVPVALVAAIVAVRARRPLTALSILASYFLIVPVILVGWTFWPRSRPDLVLGGKLAPGFHAFPSGHLAQAVPLYGLLTALWMRHARHLAERLLALALYLALLALLVAGRLYLGAHWPSDLAAGTLVGALWLVTLLVALRQEERRAM